jgi:phosphatidate cytidylyltransferase
MSGDPQLDGQQRDGQSQPDGDQRKAPSAGRPLGVATAVAVLLLAMIGVALLISPLAFTVLLTVGVLIGIVEVQRVLVAAEFAIPLPILLMIGVLLPAAAYADRSEGLVAAFILGVPVALLWRLAEGGPHAARDSLATVLIVVWIPLLASFLVLLAKPADGAARVLTAVLVTAASDTGGYLVGVLIGRHPMAPHVSPKKSWEGFAGSVMACGLVGVLCVALLLGGRWWIGLLLGAATVVAATVGDLGESLIKRDMGIKDMSQLLPGHGGLLDRVDALLVAAPVVWIILTAFVPVLT